MFLEADLDDIFFMHELKCTATLRSETQSLLCNEINSYMEWKLFGRIVRWANAVKKRPDAKHKPNPNKHDFMLTPLYINELVMTPRWLVRVCICPLRRFINLWLAPHGAASTVSERAQLFLYHPAVSGEKWIRSFLMNWCYILTVLAVFNGFYPYLVLHCILIRYVF